MSNKPGKAEKNIAELFRAVHAELQAVLCIDEVEALFPARRGNRSTIMQRVIPEFLSHMDGVDTHRKKENNSYHLMVGMTNWPEALDEAFLRPGRFDVRVFVDLPNQAARQEILSSLLRTLRLAPNVSIDALAAQTEGYSGADLTGLVNAAKHRTFLSMVHNTTQPARKTT